MSIRQRFGRGAIRLALGVVAFVALAMPADAQVDPDDIPASFFLTSTEDCRALRNCLSSPTLRAEVETCFAAGPLRRFDFRLFYQGATDSVYLGRLVFGGSTTAIALNFVHRTGRNPDVLVTSTAPAAFGVGPVVIPDLDTYDFLCWFVQENQGPLSEFAEENGVLGLLCSRVGSRLSEEFSARFVAGELDFATLSPVVEPRKVTLFAAVTYSPILGYYDLQID